MVMAQEDSFSSVTDASFEREILKAAQPTIVAFWAPWSAAWKQIQPFLESLGDEFRTQVKLVRAGIDANPMTASQYGVGLLPSLVIVWRGRVVEMRDGLMDQASMRRLFELAARLPDAPA
jgi:thioredoxin 1